MEKNQINKNNRDMFETMNAAMATEQIERYGHAAIRGVMACSNNSVFVNLSETSQLI